MLDGPVGDKVKASLEPRRHGRSVLLENGFRNLTNNKRPITRLEKTCRT